MEGKLVKEIVQRLLKMRVKPEWIGVITPYDDQGDLISSLIDEIEVKTVDGYQGREKEIIVFWMLHYNIYRDS